MAAWNFEQHCRNHEAREAACRCPSCGHSYCRECVTEHEGRLLCAACLGALAPAARRKGGALRRFTPVAMLAAGIVLAWLAYWAVGESIISMIRRMEQQPRASGVDHLLSWSARPVVSREAAGQTTERDRPPHLKNRHA